MIKEETQREHFNHRNSSLGRCVNAMKWNTTRSNVVDAQSERDRDALTSQRTLRGLCSSRSTFHCVYTVIMVVTSVRQRNSGGAVGDLMALLRRPNFVSTAYLSERRAMERTFRMFKVGAIALCSRRSHRDN